MPERVCDPCPIVDQPRRAERMVHRVIARSGTREAIWHGARRIIRRRHAATVALLEMSSPTSL